MFQEVQPDSCVGPTLTLGTHRLGISSIAFVLYVFRQKNMLILKELFAKLDAERETEQKQILWETAPLLKKCFSQGTEIARNSCSCRKQLCTKGLSGSTVMYRWDGERVGEEALMQWVSGWTEETLPTKKHSPVTGGLVSWHRHLKVVLKCQDGS